MTRAFVCGCAGEALSEGERGFIREARPWGLILFKRNITEPDSVRRLIEEFRSQLDAGLWAVLQGLVEREE